MSRSDNRTRAFSEAVSVDAWHQPFDAGRAIVDLHADVAFTTARLGGEATSPVRFRLSVRQAELVVVVPEVEPVTVVSGSVSRDTPQVSGRRITNSEQHSHAQLRAGATVSSVTGTLPLFGASASGGLSHDASTTTEVITTLSDFVVTQAKTEDGYYKWILEPSVGDRLAGHPWDAVAKPRLKLKDHRDEDEHLPAVVRVEVRCKREDLIIEEIVIKNGSMWEGI